MKTTIDLPDDLLERGKETARRENSTLKALIEEGLRMALRARASAARHLRFSPSRVTACPRNSPALAGKRFAKKSIVIAVDTNILVYAHRTDSPFHALARSSIEALARGVV